MCLGPPIGGIGRVYTVDSQKPHIKYYTHVKDKLRVIMSKYILCKVYVEKGAARMEVKHILMNLQEHMHFCIRFIVAYLLIADLWI